MPGPRKQLYYNAILAREQVRTQHRMNQSVLCRRRGCGASNAPLAPVHSRVIAQQGHSRSQALSSGSQEEAQQCPPHYLPFAMHRWGKQRWHCNRQALGPFLFLLTHGMQANQGSPGVGQGQPGQGWMKCTGRSPHTPVCGHAPAHSLTKAQMGTHSAHTFPCTHTHRPATQSMAVRPASLVRLTGG